MEIIRNKINTIIQALPKQNLFYYILGVSTFFGIAFLRYMTKRKNHSKFFLSNKSQTSLNKEIEVLAKHLKLPEIILANREKFNEFSQFVSKKRKLFEFNTNGLMKMQNKVIKQDQVFFNLFNKVTTFIIKTKFA
jgi:hypothetical protein